MKIGERMSIPISEEENTKGDVDREDTGTVLPKY